MKTLVTACLAFWLLASVSFAQEEHGKIPYRVLWHAYQLGLCSDKQENYLHIISKEGVSPAKFRYTPLTANGYQVCKSYANGLCQVYWYPDFYEKNQLIVVNQPKGSVTINFAGGRDTLYEAKYPLIFNVIKYGDIWRRMIYHSYMLSIEFGKMEQQEQPS